MAKVLQLDLQIRFFESFSRTFDGLKPALAEISNKHEKYDAIVNFGVGVVDPRDLNHGFEEGTVHYGVYGIQDIVYNSHLEEYILVNRFDQIKRYAWTGQPLPDQSKLPKKKFKRFIYVPQNSTYICWIPFKKTFFLAKTDFTIIVEYVALFPIRDIIHGERPNPENNVDFFVLADASCTHYTFNPTNNIITLADCLELADIEADNAAIETFCFDNPTDDKKQWIYLTYNGNCCVADVTGRFHGTKKNLHEHQITAICASNNSDYVVTGDSKGFLKLWGQKKWVPIADIRPHNSAVQILLLHPSGAASVSLGRDEIIFSWSFESLCKLDRVKNEDIVTRIAINKERKSFMAIGLRKLVIWKMQELYRFHTPLSAPMRRTDLTWHPRFTQRAYVTCEDNSIRIVNPVTGAILINVLPSTASTIRQLVYHRNEEMNTMFILISAGESPDKLEIQQWDCGLNPARLRTTWEDKTWEIPLTAIGLYDYVPTYQLPEKEMSFAGKKVPKFTGRAIFLIGGRRDGYVCQLSPVTGEELFFAKCHHSPVSRIEVNNEMGQFASMGIDPSIRIWKILLVQDEDPFVPLIDISWKYPIRHLAWTRQYLCFALTNVRSSTHRIIVYDMAKAERHDNNKKHRHSKEILSVSACPELTIFCSASLDETIRIWNKTCHCNRILGLNWVPSAAGFSSRQGDIFVGLGSEVHVLPAEKYLTCLPRNRAIQENFGPGEEEPIPELELAKTGDDARLLIVLEGLKVVELVPPVSNSREPLDSKQSGDKYKLQAIEEDIRRIARGDHPRDPNDPDVENMSKKEWDEYVKNNYEGEDGEDRKFFVSRNRKDAMLKMRQMKKELDNFDNIA